MKATVRYGFTPQSSTVVLDNNCWPGSGEISSLLQRSHKHKRCSQLETRLIVSQVVIHRATPNPAAHSRDNINCHATVHGSTIQKDQSRKNLNPPKVMNGYIKVPYLHKRILQSNKTIRGNEVLLQYGQLKDVVLRGKGEHHELYDFIT